MHQYDTSKFITGGRILHLLVQALYLKAKHKEERSATPNCFFKAIINTNILHNSTVVADVMLSGFDSVFT